MTLQELLCSFNYTPQERKSKWNADNVLDVITQFVAEQGRLPYSTELGSNGLPSHPSIRKVTGKTTTQFYLEHFKNYVRKNTPIKPIKDGYYKLEPVYNTGLALDVRGGAPTYNGQWAEVYTDNNGPAQRWAFFSNGDRSYRLMSKVDNQAKCISVNGGYTTSPTNLHMWDYTQAQEQGWILENGRTLNTPEIGQEKSMWCWAASALMAAKTNTYTTKTQSDIVREIKGSVIDEDADEYETLRAVQYASGNSNYVLLEHTLSEAEIKQKIDAGFPIILCRGWYPNGPRENGHVSVLYGYRFEGTYVKYLIRDPSPVGTGYSYVRSYGQIVDGTATGIDDYKWEHSIFLNE